MKELAECVGLWLAEGGKTLTHEVTFTNNCVELILFFDKVIRSVYSGGNKPRIYIYSPSPRKLFDLFNGFKVKYYYDRRANRTYFMYRLADVNFVQEWKNIVETIQTKEKFYPEILRGFFAGDGNIKHFPDHNNSRSIRIAQKSDAGREYIEMLLDHFKINFTYDPKHREYIITSSQLEKTNKIDIASLHPEKEAKFRKMINSISEVHYPPGYLKIKLLSLLNEPRRTKDLADILNRSDARILDILRVLRSEGTVKYLKKKGGVIWAKKKIINDIIIKRRLYILNELDTYKNITEIARVTGVSRKVASKRLILLQSEGLVNKVGNKWVRLENKELICGVDEAGKGA